MNNLTFTKMVASGNDFIVVCRCAGKPVSRLAGLAKVLCDRKYGIGADGLLYLEESPKADVRMRIINADGSEAEMCGNGARCAAAYVIAGNGNYSSRGMRIQTKAGIIEAKVSNDHVKIKLTDPKGLKLDIPLKINRRTMRVNFINTGVPHAVVFVEGLDKIDVPVLGRMIRYYERFKPAGTNVNFVEVESNDYIKVRTYERGVEDETLACGTGSVASALITALKLNKLRDVRMSGCQSVKVSKCQSVRVLGCQSVKVKTRGGDVLRVYFERMGNEFRNVWLEGEARVVFEGEYKYEGSSS